MANEILIDSPLTHGTALIRRSWIERVNGWTDRDWAEDLDLWLRLVEAGAVLAKQPRVLYGWRQHRSSATRCDPRYGRERFISLKSHALAQGILRGHSRLTLVGVGESLARWHVVLTTAHVVDVIEARRPSATLIETLQPPVVLVVGAAAARARWREAFGYSEVTERNGFIFVA